MFKLDSTGVMAVLSNSSEANPSAPLPMRNRKIPKRDWLYAQTGNSERVLSCCHPAPPGPISGPIEAHREPDEPLSDYRDERRWSDEIIAWSKDHAQELSLEPVTYEE